MTNMLSLITTMKNTSSYISLPLRILSYQRHLYFHGIKHYIELKKEAKNTIYIIQKLYNLERVELLNKNDMSKQIISEEINNKEDEEKSESDSQSDNENLRNLLVAPRKLLTNQLITAIQKSGSPKTLRNSSPHDSPQSSLHCSPRLIQKIKTPTKVDKKIPFSYKFEINLLN